jgi:DNA-binding protein HU-beta
MNKQDFITEYALRTEQSKKNAGIQVEAFLNTLKAILATDGKVSFSGEWSMEVVPTLEKMGINPATGEKIKIPAGKKIRFKASKTLKKLVNG